ncbi:MAG: hypothetical protein ABJF10_13220 [Chthoniobacter sp.]|uniref:hypothetical protein n=1 Tax=Chthoniobacter sp. TaxID=2510640 RepID=UPI0032A264C2
MKSTILRVLLLALSLLLTGCVDTELKVANHTGGEIQLTTHHTLRTYTIPAGATRRVPHTIGTITIAAPGNVVWSYEVVDVTRLESEVTRGVQRLVLPLQVNGDGTIVLPSGRKIKPSGKIVPLLPRS